MALFHLSVTQTKRSAGQSAIASAAYRAGERKIWNADTVRRKIPKFTRWFMLRI